MDTQNKFVNILKKIDIFGFDFPLRYKQETEYNTKCGIFFSIISIIFIILLSFKYIQHLNSNNNFSLVTNYIYSEESFEIDISNIPIMLSLFSINNNIKLDETYATFQIDLNVYTPKKNDLGYLILDKTSYPLEIEECTINSFGSFKDLFSNYIYLKNICLKLNQNIKIKGRFYDLINGFTTLEIHLFKCVNSTQNNNHCKSPNEINEKLINSYISSFYISYNINHFNYNNPVYNNLYSHSFYVSLDYIKRYIYFFSKDKYISDNGKFFNTYNEYSLIQYNHIQFDIIQKKEQSYYPENLLLEIISTCHDFQTEYNRTYIKIQDFIGMIGGIIDIVCIFFKIISYNFVKKSFILDIGKNFISINFKKINLNNNHNSDYSNQNILKINNKCNATSIPLKHKRIENINACTLFNIKLKNDILINLDINEEELKMLQQFEKRKKDFIFYLLYYICPFFALKNFNQYKTFDIYSNIFQKFVSIDFLIPIVLKSYQSLNK